MNEGEVQSSVPTVENIWSSSHPQIIEINQRTGKANALHEGKAEILLSNNINAASLVQVSKVKYAEVDQASRKNLVLNTDEKGGDKRIKVKMFLQDSAEELTPSVQFDGITLIENNVGLLCETDLPNLINAQPEINELEGFFCVISLKSTQPKAYPRTAQVTVSAYGFNPKDPKNVKNALYMEKLLTFDITLLSKIRVESYFRDGVKLYNDQRTTSMRIYSSVPFNTYIENNNIED